jgi:transposase
MKFIKGIDRDQVSMSSLSDMISEENIVVSIDLFVDSINLEDFGFNIDHTDVGRPAFHPSDLLKLFIYGYMNSIRSSRDLEKECRRNVELMWLLKGLKPDHSTINDFRQKNELLIVEVFKATVKIAKHFRLIGGALIAGDSTKMRAQNSKKNNYNKDKLTRKIKNIEKKLSHYFELLNDSDQRLDRKERGEHQYIKAEIEAKIAIQNKIKAKYETIAEELEKTGVEQISTSDPDSRELSYKGNNTEIAYAIQTVSDGLNSIPIDYEVTNKPDNNAMGRMVSRAVTILETDNSDYQKGKDFKNQNTRESYNKEEPLIALFDKGYHTGSQLKEVQDLGVYSIVDSPGSSSKAPTPEYDKKKFVYNKSNDEYICPDGYVLTKRGKQISKKTRVKGVVVKYQLYKCKNYKTCPNASKCVKGGDARRVERSEYEENIEINKEHFDKNKALYDERKCIIEHPFGTLKRGWHFDYIITKKGQARASADVGFMFISYNLKRIINLTGIENLNKFLKELVFSFYKCFQSITFSLTPQI